MSQRALVRLASPRGGKAELVKLVAYANRLPISRGRQGWRPSVGGLVSALRPALESRGGAWIGWDGGADDIPRRIEGLDVELLPVRLSRREVGGLLPRLREPDPLAAAARLIE